MIGARLLFQRCCNRYTLTACTKHRTFTTSSVLCKKTPPVNTEVIWPDKPSWRNRNFQPQERSFDRRESKPGGVEHVSGFYSDDKDSYGRSLLDEDHDEDYDDDDDDDWEFSANDTIDQISEELSNFQLSKDESKKFISAIDQSLDETAMSSLDDIEKGVLCVCGRTFKTERGMKIHRTKAKCLSTAERSDVAQNTDNLSASHDKFFIPDTEFREASDTLGSNSPPGNILGDLESLFGESDHQQVDEEELLDMLDSDGYVDSEPPNYDITVYHNVTQSGEADSYVLEGDLEGAVEQYNMGIPVNHVLEYIRESKGVDTVVIEVGEEASYVKYVIVCTVLNKRQLKGLGEGLASLCKHEYNAVWSDPVEANLGDGWVTLDTGTCAVHFMTEAERERVNLESFWLGQDRDDEGTNQEQYTNNLIEGLFPDEDFTKLAKPWELQYEED